jgi:hypothetical protein
MYVYKWTRRVYCNDPHKITKKKKKKVFLIWIPPTKILWLPRPLILYKKKGILFQDEVSIRQYSIHCFKTHVSRCKWLHLSYANQDDGHNKTKHFNITLKYSNFIQHSGLDDMHSDSRQRQEIFLLTKVSELALWPTQPPIQLVPRVLSLRVRLTIQLPPAFKAFTGMTLPFSPLKIRLPGLSNRMFS